MEGLSTRNRATNQKVGSSNLSGRTIFDHLAARLLRGFFHGVQAGAVLFFSLLHGKNAATEVSDLSQFLLDFLESFMPLAVGYLRFCFGVGLTAVLVVQLLELSDFSA
ncbi:MAG: hypothetical protein WA437_07770 [Candidatus Sulfotelmatobacter sp.]